MNLKPAQESPFQLLMSFNKIIERLEQVAASATGARRDMAKEVLAEIAPFSELRAGITHIDQIENNTAVIHSLLAELFPEALNENEIKAVTIPFHDILVNPTKRFQQIIDGAGPLYDISIRGFNEHQFYVMSCCLIINTFYGGHLNFSKPLYYDIPTVGGIMKHYRILYNADFLEILPTENSISLTASDIDLLADNFYDIDLWKRYFPADSWILKGFAIVSLYDATVENAVSTLKGSLLAVGHAPDIKEEVISVFHSIYNIAELRVGFTAFEADENKFTAPVRIPHFSSFLLDGLSEEKCTKTLCGESFEKVINQGLYYAVSDVEARLIEDPDNVLAMRFHAQNIKSFILAPMVKNGHLVGIFELVSSRSKALNSINANRLEVVMPFITDIIDMQLEFLQNYVRALIQREYTAMHPSVYWKFRKEALNFIDYSNSKKDYTFKDITFKDVYPLYGQIDIQQSSEARNSSITLDLQAQLTALRGLLQQLPPLGEDLRLNQKIEQLDLFTDELQLPLRADTEQRIQDYLHAHIHPLLNQLNTINKELSYGISQYFGDTDKGGAFHKQRRKYEDSVALINERMAMILDSSQIAVQANFPHYYERFKTDGVEHNLYIGASIRPTGKFELAHLYNLRLWQLQALCQMELEHYSLKASLHFPFNVTSLILAFAKPISIRFRMDEKRFDVDGSYNARFEIIKKRIDKAFIKDSRERITAVDKLTIVYANQQEQQEYEGYIRFLQSKHILTEEIEILDIEDLQGIAGLKAIRVKISHHTAKPAGKFYTYQEMLSHGKQMA
jgi:hypothetical protein